MKRLLAVTIVLCLLASGSFAQDFDVNSRHVRHYVRPTLPEIAKRMNLKGTVKLEIDIASNGKVTAVRPVGGHPVLVEAATEAVRGWQFDPAKDTTTGPVTVVFQ